MPSAVSCLIIALYMLCIVHCIAATHRAQQTVWRHWLKWFMITSRSSRAWWQPFTRTRQPRRRLMVRRRRTGAVDARLQPTSFHRQPEQPRLSEKSSRSWTASWLAWHSAFRCQMCPLSIWLAALRKRWACQFLNYYFANRFLFNRPQCLCRLLWMSVSLSISFTLQLLYKWSFKLCILSFFYCFHVRMFDTCILHADCWHSHKLIIMTNQTYFK